MKLKRQCGKCGGNGELKRTIFSNGDIHVSYCCEKCGHSTPWLKKDEIIKAAINIYELELREIWNGNEKRQCEVEGCLNTGYEWHHIAPRHLFGDEYGRWPIVKLCKYHHRQWHAIVTPNMTKVTQ